MKTTLTGPCPPFLGVDLTDRYSQRRKPIDVCGLSPRTDGTLDATFWQWKWGPADQPIVVRRLLPELNDAMLDAPQGLADSPERMRVCERMVGAAGKTPFERPRDISQPFAGFVLSGLDLFDALERALDGEGSQLASSVNVTGKVGEVYPGDLWPRLAAPGLMADRLLPKKTSREGRLIRRELLKAAGVRFEPTFGEGTHDQLDACLAAIVAAARRCKVPDLETHPVGKPIYRDYRDSNYKLREGEMYRLEVTGEPLRNKIQGVLDKFAKSLVGIAPTLHPDRSRAAAGLRSAVAQAQARSALEWIWGCKSREPADRAVALLSWLLHAAGPGGFGPLLLGYGAAWKLVHPHLPYPVGHGANAWREIIEIAEATPQQGLPAFGAVRLDTFLVAESGSRATPGSGHWETAQYDEEDWLKVFGEALLIRAKDVPN
jgi:hypothetical protein